MHERFETETAWDKAVADYARMDMPSVDELPWGTWLILRRDAFISRMRGTQAGREWLDTAWRLSLTDMDADGLRSRFGSNSG